MPGGSAQGWASGSGQDLALFDKFLKDWYMEQWVDLFNNQTNTAKYIRRKVVPFKGRQMIIALRTGESGAVQAIPLSGFNDGSGTGAWKTVTPGYQTTDNALVKPKIIMSAIGIPQDVIDVSENDRGAFYEVVDFEMQGIKVTAAKYFDLMLYRGGRELAEKTAGSTTTTDIVDNYFPFYKGKRVESWTTNDTAGTELSNAAAADYQTVSAVSRTEGATGFTVTYSNASSAPPLTSAYPYTVGARTTTTNLELTGMLEIVSNVNMKLRNYAGNTNYLGIDRTTTNEWQAQVIDMVGGALTFDSMQQMCDEVHDNSPGDINAMFSHRAVRRRWARQIAFAGASELTAGAATFRFQNTQKFSGSLVEYKEDEHGAESEDFMKFNGRIPFFVDRYCPIDLRVSNNSNGMIFCLDLRHWYMAQVCDWRWWAPQGRILREAQNGAFGVVAHNYMMGELVCDLPSTSGVIKNIDCF